MIVRIVLAVLLQLAPWLRPGVAEHHAFYHPRPLSAPAPAGFEEVWFESADGTRLHGWFLPAATGSGRDGPAPAIVHAHGNTGHVGNHAGITAHLAEIGCHVLVFDYRGFGRSDPPSGLLRRHDLVADTVAAIDFVASRPDVDAERIGVFGYSLGAVLALAGAAERPHVDAVVAFAPFASWRDVAADHAGPFGHWLIGDGVDAEDSLERLGETPVLIVHGRRDRTVRHWHALTLREVAEGSGLNAEVVLLEEGNHISLGADAGVRARVRAFFGEALLGRSGGSD